MLHVIQNFTLSKDCILRRQKNTYCYLKLCIVQIHGQQIIFVEIKSKVDRGQNHFSIVVHISIEVQLM